MIYLGLFRTINAYDFRLEVNECNPVTICRPVCRLKKNSSLIKISHDTCLESVIKKGYRNKMTTPSILDMSTLH